MSDCPSTKDGYLAFDALSLKQHIKDRLNESGVFTDQNYEGSYISTVIDIIAYTFNVLMFYLNKTSSESMFWLFFLLPIMLSPRFVMFYRAFYRFLRHQIIIPHEFLFELFHHRREQQFYPHA